MRRKKIASWRISLIVLVCCLGVNDAIPFGQYASSKHVNQNFNKLSALNIGENKLEDPREGMYSLTESQLITKAFNKLVNTVHKDEVQQEVSSHQKLRSSQSVGYVRDNSDYINDNDDSGIVDNDDSTPDVEFTSKTNGKGSKGNETVPEKCSTNVRKTHRGYSQSFPVNGTSFDISNVLNVTGKEKAKKTSSIHTGADITLCWIETTTIKEDPTFEPPKKIVIREYTISLENAAAIPDNYLECVTLDGEIVAGDEKTVCNTSLNEVIDDDTRRSRVVNLTSSSRVGPIIIHQVKIIKCATGPTVSKDIYEWPNDLDNPSKRVEIKVSPSISTIVSSDEPGICARQPSSPKPEEDHTTASSVADCIAGETCSTIAPCEDGKNCHESETTLPCENANCSTSSVFGKSPSTINPLDATNKPSNLSTPMKIPAIPIATLPHINVTNSCAENDKDCKSLGSTEKIETEVCSGENCTAECSSTESGSGECSNSSEACSGEGDCKSTEKSVSTMDEKITTDNSVDDSVSTPSLQSESSLSNKIITTPLNTALNTTDQVSLDKDVCDSASSECLGSSLTPLPEAGQPTTIPGKNGTGFAGKLKKSIPRPTSTTSGLQTTTERQENENTLETPDSAETDPSKEVPLVTPTPSSCDGVESDDCTTTILPVSKVPLELSKDTQEKSPPNIALSQVSVIPKNNSKLNESELSNETDSNSCEENSSNENCRSTESSSESESDEDNEIIDSSSEAITQSPLSASNEPEGTTLSSNHSVNLTSTPDINLDNSTAANLTKLPISTIKPRLSSDAPATTIKLKKKHNELPSLKLKAINIPAVICESPDGCGSTLAISNTTEKNKPVPGNYTPTEKVSAETSCDSSNESCESESSANSSESYEEGSSKDNCTDNSSECCDASTECLSGENNSSTVVNQKSNSINKPPMSKVDDTPTTTEKVSTIVPDNSSTVDSDKGLPKLALKIKVLLEHINEKKEKKKLVQLEKHLLLNERPQAHENHTLLGQIKSLNKSMSLETFKSLLNFTSLGNFTEEFSHLTDFQSNNQGKIALQKNTVTLPFEEDSTTEIDDDVSNHSTIGPGKSASRRKRELPKDTGEKKNNSSDATILKAIKQSLPGVNADFREGLDHVAHRLSQEFNSSASSAVAKPPTSTILKVLANPADKKIPSRRRKRSSKIGVLSIEELKHPVHGKEIDRWSNERFVNAAGGSRIRSLMEFKLMKDLGKDSLRIPSGS